MLIKVTPTRDNISKLKYLYINSDTLDRDDFTKDKKYLIVDYSDNMITFLDNHNEKRHIFYEECKKYDVFGYIQISKRKLGKMIRDLEWR